MNILSKIKYTIHHYKKNIKTSDIYRIPNYKIKYNVGLILAAGNSSRFNINTPKQLFVLNGVPMINYSIEAMINNVDKLIIVSNSKCLEEINIIVSNYNIFSNNRKIVVLTNDIDCRLESIKKCLEYIQSSNLNVTNIIIHDSARPYIKHSHINELLKMNDTCLYSQYYLKLVNGLAVKILNNNNNNNNNSNNNTKYEMIDREQYIEVCTPVCCNYYLFYFIFMNYIDKPNRIVYEILPILNLFNIKYNMIEGSYKYLRKITIMDDVT
jgi:2-C-methyl-D-erythritol 4-phosphate cytidylyltransferase